MRWFLLCTVTLLVLVTDESQQLENDRHKEICDIFALFWAVCVKVQQRS